MGFKGWWHRQKVGTAADDVKYWRFWFYFWNFVAIVFLLLSLNAILRGSLSFGALGLGAGVCFLWVANFGGTYGKMRKATHEERIRLAADLNRVPIEELRARLEGRK